MKLTGNCIGRLADMLEEKRRESPNREFWEEYLKRHNIRHWDSPVMPDEVPLHIVAHEGEIDIFLVQEEFALKCLALGCFPPTEEDDDEK